MVQTAKGVTMKTSNVYLLEVEEVGKTNISIPVIQLITRIIRIIIKTMERKI